ncbi:MAG TPA: DNA polymerase Y family protein [Steroidobacteraceae bacterium]|nr:DNA polymerase Y family protein [Steroidobacteraceae bacterium]
MKNHARMRPARSPAPGLPSPSASALSLAAPALLEELPGELWLAVHLLEGGNARLLAQVAQLALRFSPRVSLEPPDAVLLEVRGSLALFAGVSRLRQALLEACAPLGQRLHVALAPTPLAALTLARAGAQLPVLQRAALIGALAPLPLAVLRWPSPLPERLKRIGVRTLGALLRLPRGGFARRFGVAQLALLDRLTGRTPEVRALFQPRARFRRRRELAWEAEHHAELLSALAPLLEELEDFLRARQAGVMRLECQLLHRAAPATLCRLQLSAPAAAAAQLRALLATQLERCVLPQPVRALELRAGTLLPLSLASGQLWQPGEHGGGAGSEAHALIERLHAHLGEGAIHGLTLLDDHRPERSWALAPPPSPRRGKAPVTCGAVPVRRPLWLLNEPEPLTVRAGRPRRRGALQLVSEPERIESGWWDGRDVARDYYTALDRHGVRLWVFRERRAPHGWFLHGIFG